MAPMLGAPPAPQTTDNLTYLGLPFWCVCSLFFTLKTPGRGHALEADELKFDLRLDTTSA